MYYKYNELEEIGNELGKSYFKLIGKYGQKKIFIIFTSMSILSGLIFIKYRL